MSSTGAPYSVDYSANLAQCVPYARLAPASVFSATPIHGGTRPAGRYARGKAAGGRLRPGAAQDQSAAYGHVAVVTQRVNPREIRIDHANWQRGAVITGMPVIDVSPANDWTQLRFWNKDARMWGAIYPAEGFIYNAPAGAQTEPSDLGTTIISSEGQRYWAPQQPLP